MHTKIDRLFALPPLVPEGEWNVPEPMREWVPEYVSYELVVEEEGER